MLVSDRDGWVKPAPTVRTIALFLGEFMKYWFSEINGW